MCRQAVRDWLVLLTMEKYMDTFLMQGYDSIAHCKLIVSTDLVMLGVDDPSHRKLLLNGVQFLNNTTEFTEACKLHQHLETEDENPGEGTATAKYSDRFSILDSPKQWKFPKRALLLSTDDDEILVSPIKVESRTNQPKRMKCRKALVQELDAANIIIMNSTDEST